jgi:hypothetical protein
MGLASSPSLQLCKSVRRHIANNNQIALFEQFDFRPAQMRRSTTDHEGVLSPAHCNIRLIASYLRTKFK